MKKTNHILIAACITMLLLSATTTMAMDKTLSVKEARTLIQPFYNFLGGKATEAQVRPAFDQNWHSFWGNGEKDFRTLDQTLGFFAGPLRQMIPDLDWQIKDVMVTTDNRIVVRGEGTGTPAKTLLGFPAVSGKAFKIMSLDIHSVMDGKIIKTFHIEDWFTAISQISPAK